VPILYPPVRLDIMQRVMVEIFSEELQIPVVWGKSNMPRVPRPYMRLTLLSGPTRIQIRHEQTPIDTRSSYIMNVPVPNDGDVWRWRVNGVPFQHVSPAGESQTDLMTAIAQATNADREPVSAAGIALGQLVFSETDPSSLVALWGEAPLTLEQDPAATDGCALLHNSRSEVTFGMQIMGADNRTGTARSAGELISMVPLTIDLDRVQNRLLDERITLNDISGASDISDVEDGGAENESRYTMDFAADITSMYAEPISSIETVEGEIVVGSRTVPFEAQL